MIDLDAFYINPIQLNDAWNICNFVIANEDRLKRYFPDTLEQNSTPDLSKYFVGNKVKEFRLNEEYLFILKVKASYEFVGLVYIKDLDWDKNQGEFAYCIGYPFEGKGIMQKVIKALSIYAFEHLNLQSLQIITHKSNIGSVMIAEKCNFKWQKTLENEFTPRGEQPLDMELYELYK